MKYARSMRKAALARRIVLSWIVVAVIFLIIGFCIGVAAGRAWDCTVPVPGQKEEIL